MVNFILGVIGMVCVFILTKDYTEMKKTVNDMSIALLDIEGIVDELDAAVQDIQDKLYEASNLAHKVADEIEQSDKRELLKG